MGNVFLSSVSLLKGNMFLGGVFRGCVQRLTFAVTYGRPANIYGCNPSMRAGGLQGKHHKKSVCAWEYGNTIKKQLDFEASSFQTSVDSPAIRSSKLLIWSHLGVQLKLHMGITMVMLNPQQLGEPLYCETYSILNGRFRRFNGSTANQVKRFGKPR
jgi:hypothetical protein